MPRPAKRAGGHGSRKAVAQSFDPASARAASATRREPIMATRSASAVSSNFGKRSIGPSHIDRLADVLVQSLGQGMQRRRQVGKVGVLIEGVGLRDALTDQRCEEDRFAAKRELYIADVFDFAKSGRFQPIRCAALPGGLMIVLCAQEPCRLYRVIVGCHELAVTKPSIVETQFTKVSMRVLLRLTSSARNVSNALINNIREPNPPCRRAKALF